jgi:hypothetical protein
MSRSGLAVLLLAAWIGALGWQVRRVFFPAQAQRLALGVRAIPPGVAYYAVYRDARRVGWGQIDVDTLPAASGFRVRDRIFLDQPALGIAGRSERTTLEYLDSSLNLDSLTHLSVVGDDTARVRALSRGDSVVLLFDGSGNPADRVRIPEPVTTDAGWRLRLAAGGARRAGQQYGVVVFDPLAEIARSREIEILEATSLAFPDSADTDSISGNWIAVREDTVQAWRVRDGTGVAAREVWVDEDGRLVDGEIFGGLRVERTAFELAFFARPGSSTSPPEAEKSQPEEPE